MNRNRLWQILPTMLGLALLGGAVYVLQKEFRNLKLADIAEAMAAIPNTALLAGVACTLLAYAILTVYDRLGTVYAGHPVSYARNAFASFCAYTLAHNIGVAAVSGAAVRYRLYAQWGLMPVEIGKVIAFCAFTFGLGALPLAGLILFIEPRAIPFFGEMLPVWALYAIGAVLWATSLTYIVMSKLLGKVRLFGADLELPNIKLAFLQIALATVDVAVTAGIFYVLLPAAPGLTFTRFLGIYLASYSAGILASLPGGIGVFDTAILIGLSPYFDTPTIVSGIVVFRLYYYIIPLFIAGPSFAGHELWLRRRPKLKG